MSEIVRISIRRVTIKENDPFTNFCRISGICNSNKNQLSMKILKLIYDNNKMNPTDLSRLTGMSRGAILNQLEHLCESGFIFKYGKDYYLRDQTFSKIVELIEKDIINTLEQMKAYAKEMDDTFSEN